MKLFMNFLLELDKFFLYFWVNVSGFFEGATGKFGYVSVRQRFVASSGDGTVVLVGWVFQLEFRML